MVTNSVSDAQLAVDENSCQLEDVEMCFDNVQDVHYVEHDGQAGDLKETFADCSEFTYYYCTNCQQDWRKTAVQSQEEAWKLVKEHLSDV